MSTIPRPQAHGISISKVIPHRGQAQRNGQAFLGVPIASKQVPSITKTGNDSFPLLLDVYSLRLLTYRDGPLRLANPYPSAVPNKHTEVPGCQW